MEHIIIEETPPIIHTVERGEPAYPERLMDLPKMPKMLYYLGSLPPDDQPTVSIIGARAASPYGRIQAFRYAKVLSEAGVRVISGLAYGIDSEGHKGALEGKSPTYAVLGCGVDRCYPKSNRVLYQRIEQEGGGILSEYPPGTEPKAFQFPARNRIISALSDLVLVVEAREKSGSLITAGYALEQGKMVYAIPGPVNEELSRGCHKLIFDGAGIAYEPEILLSELGLGHMEKPKKEKKPNLGLATDLDMVYSCLDFRPKNLDYLVRKTGCSPTDISRILVELTLLGYIKETGRHYYVRL